MARKSMPQPLKLPDPKSISNHINFLESARSAVNIRSPKSSGVRHPFKFNSKLSKEAQAQAQAQAQAEAEAEALALSLVQAPIQSEALSMHISYCESPTSSTTIPPQTAVSLSATPTTSTAKKQERDWDRERERRPLQSVFNNNSSSSSSNSNSNSNSYNNINNNNSNNDNDNSDQNNDYNTNNYYLYKTTNCSSPQQQNSADTTSRRTQAGTPEDDMSRDTERPAMSTRVSSSKDISQTATAVEQTVTRRPFGGPTKSEVSLELPSESPPLSASSNASKRGKPNPFSLLSRSRSTRDECSSVELSPVEMSAVASDTEKVITQPEQAHIDNTFKTIPLSAENDRSLRSMMSSNVRHHSADRVTRSRNRSKEQSDRARDQREYKKMKDPQVNGRSQAINTPKEHNRNPASFSTTGGNNFLNNLKSQATKGAGAISKGLFGKSHRSGSTTEKAPEVDDESYQLKVINLPLVQQTRLTRISKKLENSRDKTEFWMPAFPWRAIDYLNYKGSDVEGLYRVPGSGPEIKKWKRRFDQELDIDLFEQQDLYDINIIGSMLKSWLRELPDELLPKAAQDRISRECAPCEKVPQLLIDELSNLSPFNYYLLFAITCHLSLLLAHSDKNKMDYRNLCICFQPCMRIDAFCFKFLVCDWRDCWKGCKTEPFYVEQEYIIFDQMNNRILEGRSSTAVESVHDDHERNVSSSDSSKPNSVSIEQNPNINDTKGFGPNPPKCNSISGPSSTPMLQRPKLLPMSQSTSSVSTTTTTSALNNEKTTPPHKEDRDDMRPLSPIQPLSPIGL